MKLTRVVGLVAIVVLTAVPLFAAGSSEGPSEEQTAVTFWRIHAPAFNVMLDEMAADYMADNPDVYIQFEDFDYDTYIQTLQTAFPSGTEADLIEMFGTWVASYSARLAKVPTSLMSASKARESFVPSTLGGYLVDGGLYGIPFETNIEYGAVLVNTALADSLGVDYQGGWNDWDDFITEMKKLVEVEDGVMMRAGYGFAHSDGIAYHFLSLIRQYGGNHMNASGSAFTFNTPEARQALQLMKRLVDEGLVDPLLFNDEENWAGDGYFSEVIGAVGIGPWVIPDYEPDFPEIAAASEYIPMPYIGDSPVFTAASGWGLTVSANSDVADTAWDIIEYLSVNAENALRFNIGSATLPALKANLEGNAANQLVAAIPYMKAFTEILPFGQYQGHMPDSDLIVYDILYNNVLQYLQGNISIDEALEAIQSQSQETM